MSADIADIAGISFFKVKFTQFVVKEHEYDLTLMVHLRWCLFAVGRGEYNGREEHPHQNVPGVQRLGAQSEQLVED